MNGTEPQNPSFAELARTVDEAVTGRIATYDQTNPMGRAMHYAMAGGGKRLRGVLALTAPLQAGLTPQPTLPVALAVELLHAYTLAHDDLPAMDNSPTRRGRPSTHVAHGEALALLAGNALMGDGLLALADLTAHRFEAAAALLGGIGAGGVMLGQALDMADRDWTTAPPEDILQVHALKTVRLFEAAMTSALAALGNDAAHGAALGTIATALGYLLQWVDDLEDDLDALPRTEPSLLRTLGREALTERIDTKAREALALIDTLPAPRALREMILLLQSKTQ